jgi:hypothetical protein
VLQHEGGRRKILAERFKKEMKGHKVKTEEKKKSGSSSSSRSIGGSSSSSSSSRV